MKKYILVTVFLITISTLSVSFIAPAFATAPKFRLPLSQNRGYYQYYDNKAGSGLRDWKCGTKTYEGHPGTDFIANYGDPIYAGANGGLYYRYDCCADYGSWGNTCGGGYGNHVRIDHEYPYDGKGWVTIYAHMKKGSPAWYQSLLCKDYGTKIGEAASSGKSTAIHLHFEVRKYGYPYDDPFAGRCSGPISYWVNQNNGYPTTQCQ